MIKPSQVPLDYERWLSTFGWCELELSAKQVVRFCLARGDSFKQSFTLTDLQEFIQDSGLKTEDEFLTNGLVGLIVMKYLIPCDEDEYISEGIWDLRVSPSFFDRIPK